MSAVLAPYAVGFGVGMLVSCVWLLIPTIRLQRRAEDAEAKFEALLTLTPRNHIPLLGARVSQYLAAGDTLTVVHSSGPIIGITTAVATTLTVQG